MRRLYHHPLSPFSRKIRLILAEKKLPFQLTEERFWEKRVDFLRLNPAGQVPVLVDETSIPLADSTAIAEYLEECYPEIPLGATTPERRAEIRRVAAWFDVKFHREVTSKLLYERVFKRLMRQGHPDSNQVRAGAANLRTHLEFIGWIMESQNWLAGDQLSIADFAAAAQISVLDYSGDVDWSVSRAARSWYARVKSRPAFRGILADSLPGLRPVPHYDDLDF